MKPPEVGFLQAKLSGLADEAEVVVHQGADGEDVGRVDASADDFQTDFVVLDKKKPAKFESEKKREHLPPQYAANGKINRGGTLRSR